MAWEFDDPFEDTDTLVLTSGQGWFVDVRFALHGDGWDGIWAFAGRGWISFPGDTAGRVQIPYLCHCRWEHEIDSRGDDKLEDAGDVVLLPNNESVEFGSMLDPGTGKHRMYKEYWVGLEGQKRPCVVVKRSDDNGIVVRVGDWCQGIVWRDKSAPTAKERVWVERWNKKDSRSLESQNEDVRLWIKDSRSNTGKDNAGSSKMPVEWLCLDERKEGDQTTVGGWEWRVSELLK